MRQKDQQLQQPPLTSPLTRGLFHTTRPILLPWQKSESSIAGKRGSSKRRPLCRHCLFSVEYCCPSKAFTDVNILQPWGWQHVRVERHRCSWYQHTHTHTHCYRIFSPNAAPPLLYTAAAEWQVNPTDFNTLTEKALGGNGESMCAAAYSTAWIHRSQNDQSVNSVTSSWA